MSETTPANTNGQRPLKGMALLMLTIAVALSTFMEVLDLTIVNVAIPHISGSLGVSVNVGTWAISSYALANAIMQPLTGWLARRFGEVRTFTCSMMLFIVFSMFCGFAQNMPMLVISRLLQGAGSGPMVALSLTLLLSNFPKKNHGIALSIWAMTIVIAPIFGPILGGVITDHFSWPWVFYINLPIGFLAIITTWILLRKRETKIFRTPIDIIGLVLLVVGVGSLQFMLDNGSNYDWFASPLILALGIIALTCLTFLVAWEIHARHPVVDLSLFKRRNFTVGIIALSLGILAFFSITIIFPLWLQVDLDYTATWAGLAIAPIGVLSFLVSPVLGKNMHRLDLRAMVTFAFIIFAASAYWFSSFNSFTSFWTLLPPRFLMGLAVPFFFIPLNQIYLSNLPTTEIASASGLANFFRTIGSSISTAVTVTLWQHCSQIHHATLTEYIHSARPAVTGFIAHLDHSPLSHLQVLNLVNRLINREALTLAINDIFLACVVLFMVLIPLVWLARPPFGSQDVLVH